MAPRKCPDCDCSMEAIRLIDKAYYPRHATLEYTGGDDHRGVWLGRFPIQGQIDACLCPQCDRVLLYANPKKH